MNQITPSSGPDDGRNRRSFDPTAGTDRNRPPIFVRSNDQRPQAPSAQTGQAPPPHALGLSPSRPPSPSPLPPPNAAPHPNYQLPPPQGPIVAPGLRVASAQRRFLGYVLDMLLALVTLGFGWFVWAFFLAAAGTGQTPGKQFLGMRCVEAHTGKILGFGAMTGREIVGKGVLGIVTYVTFGLTVPLYLWLLWDPRTQQLWDKLVNGVVVDLH